MVRNFTIATSAVCGHIPASSVLQYRHFRVPALDSATASRVTAYGREPRAHMSFAFVEQALCCSTRRLQFSHQADGDRRHRRWPGFGTQSIVAKTLVHKFFKFNSQQCGTVLMFRLRATAVQPSNRRFQPSVHPQSHGHPEHSRQDVQIDIFASSTGEFNIITLDHMKKLKNVNVHPQFISGSLVSLCKRRCGALFVHGNPDIILRAPSDSSCSLPCCRLRSTRRLDSSGRRLLEKFPYSVQ